MTIQLRNTLSKEIMERQPSIRNFLKDTSSSITAGSWGMMSWSFQQGFEVMWDAARENGKGRYEYPLLSLWRQSLELAFKSAINDLEGGIKEKVGHDLKKLFKKLSKICADIGLSLDDELTREVELMIEKVQSFDKSADRFRYPRNQKGAPYKGITVDLDKLYQAHWIIVTWCEGVVLEIGEEFGIGPPP